METVRLPIRLKTFGEIASNLEDKGILGTYDWAMPQPWFMEVIEFTGVNPSGHIVWSYDKESPAFGRPFPITLMGWQLLQMMDHKWKREEKYGKRTAN